MSRPYFETKVMKVEKKKIYSNHIIIDGKKYILYEDEKENVYPHKKRGNWVNGENLDKIKFPCFCSYYSHYLKRRRLGQIVLGYCGSFFYQLQQIEKQESNTGVGIIETRNSLEKLIKDGDIHILKGKIIIFEEE